MRRLRLIGLAFLCLAAFCGGCRVEPPPLTLSELREEAAKSAKWECLKKMTQLSLAEAQRIALVNNPDFKSTYYAVMAARDRYYQSIGAFAPEISAGVDVNQKITDRDHIHNELPMDFPYTNAFNTTASVRATYLLFDGFSRELGILANRADWRIRAADRENAKRILLRAVAYAFYDVLLASALTEIAESDAAFQKSCLDQAANRYRNGYIAEGDYLAFKISLNAARAQAIQNRCQHMMARYALAILIGYPDGMIPERIKLLRPSTDHLHSMLPLDFYIEEALARRPDLRGMRLAIDMAHYRKLQGLSAFSPVVNAYAEAGYGRMYTHLRGYHFENSSWNKFLVGYGVEANWVLFNGFSRYNRYRELQNLYEAARLAFTTRQLQVLNDVENAYMMVHTNAECAILYQETLKWVFTQRQLVEVEYWAGNVTITRLRGAQNDLVNAEGGLALAVIALLKSDAQLVASVSGAMEEEYLPRGLPSWAENALESMGNHLRGGW